MTDFRETPGTPEDVAARLRGPVPSIPAMREAADMITDQRATIERLERVLGEAIDTLKGLAKDNPWAEWVAVPMIVGDETVVSRLEAALSAPATREEPNG